MDKLGIKIPNNYIDRMFGSEPFLIEDILAKVIYFTYKNPPGSLGTNPNAKNKGKMVETSISRIERSSGGLPPVSTLHRVKAMRQSVGASVPHLKAKLSNHGEDPNNYRHTKDQSIYDPHRSSNPSQQSHPINTRTIDNTLPRITRKQTTSAALPKIKHTSATDQRRDLDNIKMVKDIVKKDDVIEKLEEAIKAAQMQVAELERLVQIKDKKVYLHQHKYDSVFRPID